MSTVNCANNLLLMRNGGDVKTELDGHADVDQVCTNVPPGCERRLRVPTTSPGRDGPSEKVS